MGKDTYFEGRGDQVLTNVANEFATAVDAVVKAKQEGGELKTEDEVNAFKVANFNSMWDKAVEKVTKGIQTNINNALKNWKTSESDANKRAAEKLHGKNIHYNNGEDKIKWNGMILGG